MPRLNITPKNLVKLLITNNFEFVRQNWSHAIFKNFKNWIKVIVPIHNKDIPKWTASAILKDAWIKI